MQKLKRALWEILIFGVVAVMTILIDELERPRPNSTKRLVKEGHADAE
jgi:hypothetical protein